MSDDIYREILTALNKSYPAPASANGIYQALEKFDKKEVVQEIAHLKEIGLVDAALHITSDGTNTVTLLRAKITAAGRDFLKADGGISAQIGVVTIRIHADSIRDLINAHIEAAELDATAKAKIKEAVKNLPAQTLQEVVTGLVQRGLAQAPNAIQWLQTSLGL